LEKQLFSQTSSKKNKFFHIFLRFFAKKHSLSALKTALFTPFFKTVGFPQLLSIPVTFYNQECSFYVMGAS